jgi:hypothetical protein
MRNTAIAREINHSLLDSIDEREPLAAATGASSPKETSRAVLTTPPTKRRSPMLTLAPEERKARRSSALIRNRSFLQQQEEEEEEEEESRRESSEIGGDEDDEAARIRQRNKVLDVLNEYYATEAKSFESFAAKLSRNRRKQGKLYVTPVRAHQTRLAPPGSPIHNSDTSCHVPTVLLTERRRGKGDRRVVPAVAVAPGVARPLHDTAPRTRARVQGGDHQQESGHSRQRRVRFLLPAFTCRVMVVVLVGSLR